MSYPSTLKYYIWGYQPHFRIRCQTRAESLFDTLDRGLQPKVSLVGFLQNNQSGKHPICVDPENLEDIINDLSNLNKKAQEILTNHEDYNMLYSGSGVQEKVNKRLSKECYRLALEQIINDLTKHNGTLSFVSRAFHVNNYNVYIILELDRFVYNSHLHLIRKEPDERFRLRLSLLECTVEAYLNEMSDSFVETRADEFFDFDTRNSEELLREAASNFIYTISWAGRDGMGLHGLVETCNKISQFKYESQEVRGSILVAKKHHADIEMLVELQEPFSIRDHRKTRKLLQQSALDICVITNASEVLGIGKIKASYNPKNESIFKIEFTGLHCWTVMHQKVMLFQMAYGLPQFSQESINKISFFSDAKRIFSGIKDLQVEKLYNLSMSVTLAKKGAMLIISDEAPAEALRLKNQCLSIKPLPLEPELLPYLSAIDGGILIDRNGICHANGIILDGIVGTRGNSARGSRYNSALTYQEYNEFKKATMIVVVSEDGMVDVIPMLIPKIAHSEIIEVIGMLNDIYAKGQSDVGSFDEAMQWLQHRQFYLTQKECDQINELNDLLNKKTKNVELKIIYPHFKPHSDMNESYYEE